MPGTESQSLLAQIAQANARLAELDIERAATERRIAELNAEVDALPQSARQLPAGPSSRSARQKVALF